ncbi:MAG: hypothetical protein NTV29_10065 [Planctomycetota bacterium]|nr:hypothetical protein [Planctomycetota bacterium]
MSGAKEKDIRKKVDETLQTLPVDATWEDVMDRIYVRQKIENGISDVAEGKTLSVAEVRKRFGLSE